MTRALVIYESMFGNTRAIAEAIGEGMSSVVPTQVVEVGNAAMALAGDVEFVVVGGPTHAFGLSRERTRADAARQADGALVSTGIGLREWLVAAAPQLSGRRVATFDTRVDKPRLPGSAARAAARRLRRMGCTVVAGPSSFRVDGTKGPLLEGELSRARAWGARAAADAGSSAVGPGGARGRAEQRQAGEQ